MRCALTSLCGKIDRIFIFWVQGLIRELPGYCAGFQCGWLPLQRNAYTQAMFPMKFFEYLAAGLPVVATSIDALQEFQSAVWLCEPEQNAYSKALWGASRRRTSALSAPRLGASAHLHGANGAHDQTLREGGLL